MKSTASSTRAAIASMNIGWLLLLTGGRAVWGLGLGGMVLIAWWRGGREGLMSMVVGADLPERKMWGRAVPIAAAARVVQARRCRTTCGSCSASSTSWTGSALMASNPACRRCEDHAPLRLCRVLNCRMQGSSAMPPASRLRAGQARSPAASHSLALVADEDAFLERFGDDRSGMTPEQVKDLQVGGGHGKQRSCCQGRLPSASANAPRRGAPPAAAALPCRASCARSCCAA